MSTDVESLVVDRVEGRVEGDVAVLVAEDGTTTEVARALLPPGSREGAVVRVPRGSDGELAWSEAVVDEEATRERRAEAERILGELRKRDPGGDVAL